MSSHYASDRDWSESLLADAEHWISRFRTTLSMIEVAATEPVIAEITSAISNNLDTPRALLSLKSWIVTSELGATGGQAGELSRAVDALLGLTL